MSAAPQRLPQLYAWLLIAPTVAGGKTVAAGGECDGFVPAMRRLKEELTGYGPDAYGDIAWLTRSGETSSLRVRRLGSVLIWVDPEHDGREG